MAPKIPIKFLIFCLDAEIFKFKVIQYTRWDGPLKNAVNQDKAVEGHSRGFGIFPHIKNARLLNFSYFVT